MKVLVTTVQGRRAESLMPSPNPSGKKACDRCGFERVRESRRDRRSHSLCRTCVAVLTPEQLHVWES